MTADGPQRLTGYPVRDYDDLIARLGESRRSQGVSQRALAARIRVSPATLSENLRGNHRMDAHNLVALADALGYDLALIPRDRDAPRAPLSEPQGCETCPGVPESTPGRSEAAETRSEPICDCGHDGLDATWHLRPCPVAERRARLRSLHRQPHSWTPNCGETCNHDTDDYPPLQETYPGSGIYE